MNTGGPAFPVKGFQTRAGQGFVNIETQGMTLRDYFAAKAMPLAYKYWMEDYYHDKGHDADIRNEGERDDFCECYEAIAEDCYEMADAMLKAREQ